MLKHIAVLGLLLIGTVVTYAADLVIVQDGKTSTQIVVAADAGKWEKQAATDLQKYIEMMSGAKLETVEAAAGNAPQILVGSAALQADPKLKADLDNVAKKNPTLRADAIALRRAGNRVLVAGNHDNAHYYAAAWLLQNWGCRWFMPGEFGEFVPDQSTLTVGDVNFVYAPPFEVRNYWLAWNGAQDGHTDFKARNMMNDVHVPNGHHPGLADWTKALIPEGKSMFNVPIAEDATIEEVVKQTEAMYAKGEDFSLGLADGIYISDSARDKELQAGFFDKYMMSPMLTDNFMTLYNGVAERLQKKYPNSQAKIGFLAYTNITIPPQRIQKGAAPLVAYLAPIDIDPIHATNDPKSPPRQEYGEIMRRWSQVMDGRVVIYDYDQGMLVWRDLPNPVIQSFRHDVKAYRDAKILGLSTESRGAHGTIFNNIYYRAQLMWNPDADVDKLQSEFYEKFYGPAAVPMSAYWSAIEKAWEDSIVTEHEYFVIPAVYTPQLVASLQSTLEAAEKIVAPLREKADASRNEKLLVQRMDFTRASFNIIDSYTAMVRAAAGEADYKVAIASGEKALTARLALANQNAIFTTRVVGIAPESAAIGAAWFPGEVEQYGNLQKLTDGTTGTLLQKLPLEWAFRRDPNDTGLASGWAYRPVDLSYWNANKANLTIANRKDYPTTQWEVLRTDLYAQAQGVRHPDQQSFTGFGWYRTDVELPAAQTTGNTRIMFPGLFNECWLYINGQLIAHREFPVMWWNSDYKFEWDVDLTGKLRPGANTIALRFKNPHHMGGMFRRPFLYRANN